MAGGREKIFFHTEPNHALSLQGRRSEENLLQAEGKLGGGTDKIKSMKAPKIRKEPSRCNDITVPDGKLLMDKC